MDKNYWTTFYKNIAFSGPSYFAVWAQKYFQPGSTIIDLGCGEGRDCRYYRSLGFNVIGIDQAVAGRSVDRKLKFIQADFSNPADLGSLAIPALPVFTARFLLQSLSLDEERKLLSWVAAAGQDALLCIEGRAGRLPHYVFGTHYRRAVTMENLVGRLRGEHDIRIMTASKGFWSPYMEENPLVYRVTARTP